MCCCHETWAVVCSESDFQRPVTDDKWEKRALLMLYCTCTKWLQQKPAVKSTERQTITPLNPNDNMQTHINITPKPIHIFERTEDFQPNSAICLSPLLSITKLPLFLASVQLKWLCVRKGSVIWWLWWKPNMTLCQWGPGAKLDPGSSIPGVYLAHKSQ